MRGTLFLPFCPCWDTLRHGSQEPLMCCSMSSALMRAVEILPEKTDWPTPQSICHDAIMSLLETDVCSLVYSFEDCRRTKSARERPMTGANAGGLALFDDVPDVQEICVTGCRNPATSFPSSAIQRGANFFF